MMNFTPEVAKAITLAKKEAMRLEDDSVGTEHLLLGLLHQRDIVATQVLRELGVDRTRVYEIIESMKEGMGGGIISPSKGFFSEFFQPEFNEESHIAIRRAILYARDAGIINTEHLLIGLIGGGCVAGGGTTAAQILTKLGVNLQGLKERVLILLKEKGKEKETKPSLHEEAGTVRTSTPILDQFGRDLTALAKEGKLDPVIGRKKEIERLMQILCRRTKSNPVLIGEAGVGKTAIAEGLAQKIAKSEVPEVLANKRVVTMELGGIVAGTIYRGEFEKRMEEILREIRAAKNIILFIDEVHTLIGAGGAQGAIDASNILKPALARGELQCIGATTLNEYRKYIEKDSALERRFQPIMVLEPTVKETIEILKGLRDKYEVFHGVKITDGAITAAVKNSHRYIQDRFLPDKAIDVMDEAAARTKLKTRIVPEEVKKLEREIEQVEKEKDATVKAQEYEKAADIREKRNELKEKLEQKKAQWAQNKESQAPEVTEKEVADIVSSWMGIPLQDLTEEEQMKLIRMEETLKEAVIGQNEAVKIISQSIRRVRAGVKSIKRPVGVFFFIGPTGVGKTYLAKNLAKFLFGKEEALIQLDMSEYMEKFNVSRLIGAPPGYVGYQEGGELTEKVRRQPYSVILLDEIEKAHPDVYNILLQIMDDGRLSDNLGHSVDFRNTVLIMTSNLGTEQLIKGAKVGFEADQEKGLSYRDIRNQVLAEFKKSFRPEFLNRLDEVVVFHILGKKEIKKIVDLMLDGVGEALGEKGIKLKVTEPAKDLIVEQGYDPDFGARPLRRTIQRLIENPLSEKILAGKFKEGDTIRISMKEEGIVFDNK